ncbi:uncharacterized protein LOC105186166 isoform X1 [Harpegnathos saltator]|uniref:uncharacterized protein LOC105186166 isoform X1 n=1 Tax=Harpegnathos saltator TaxID=610380 RepID=UPI000DBEE2B2|nr:uncharacterized protein LOC105186166 isoform X1 [Harpegnathos saltator]
MACCKVYLVALSALIACHAVNANYEHERLKAEVQYENSRAPWNHHNYDFYEAASSDIRPRYYDFHESAEDHHDASSSEPFPISIVKKEPIEDKSFKKATSPFYAPLAAKDPLKHKEFAPNLRNAYCQEIKVKTIEPESKRPKGTTTCYRCKDPKTKSTSERCMYKSEPEETASSNMKMARILPAPINFRHRRSSSDKNWRPRNPYRFADEYFTDTTHNVPTTYQNKGEKCEKVMKDSMVCMVCKDAKTNGKYEQCSYVKQPREKAYSYTKSSTFGEPKEQKSEKEETRRETEESPYSESSSDRVSDRQGEGSAPEEGPREYSYSSDYRPTTPTVKSEQDEVQDSPTTGCKQVQKDSKTCTVCKDPKNGGTYEKCTYSYQPSDKLYKYSRSKSFGYPEKTSGTSGDADKATGASHESKDKVYPHGEGVYFDGSASSAYPRGGSERAAEDDSDGSSRGSPYYGGEYSSPDESSEATSDDEEHGSYGTTSASDRDKSASERHSENIGAEHCRKVEKDSMTCTICKDPKTGNDFEQCSYSYKPTDKLFSYSKSSSFGNPRKSDGSEYSEASDEEQQRPDGTEVVQGADESYSAGPSYEASTKDEARTKDDEAKGGEDVDTGYLHTAQKKAEIEGFLQNFRKEDRSKCKKVMRDKMTCYQCVDDKGFQKEECVFVTGEEPDKLAFHEIKEFQVDSASSAKPRTTSPPAPELVAAASKNTYVRLEKPDNDYPDEASHTAEETKEAEPYDYTSETRSRSLLR